MGQQPSNELRKGFHPQQLPEDPMTLKKMVTNPRFMEAIADVLPKHLDPDRMVRMVLGAASRNPRILKCTQESILKSMMESSTLGLDCSGLLGEGYLVPYKNGKLSKDQNRDVYEAQFQPGYQGLANLARRTGEVANVYAKPVYSGDRFEVIEGTEQRIVHEPNLDTRREKGSLKYVYAVCKYTDRQRDHDFVVLNRAEIESYRKRSKARDDGPWVTDYTAMALKTAIRRLVKWMPKSTELMQAVEADDRADEYGFGRREESARAVGANIQRHLGHQVTHQTDPDPEPQQEAPQENRDVPPSEPQETKPRASGTKKGSPERKKAETKKDKPDEEMTENALKSAEAMLKECNTAEEVEEIYVEFGSVHGDHLTDEQSKRLEKAVSEARTHLGGETRGELFQQTAT